MIRGPYNELSAFGNENCAASANSAYFGGGVDSSTRMQVSSFSPESTVTPNEMGTSANGLFFFWNDGGGGPNPASMQQQQPPVNNGIRVNGWQQPQIEQGYVPKNGENANYMQEDPSMMWKNPNPKKKGDADKGTNIWGDPAKQGPIRRWKNGMDEPVILPPEKPTASDKEKAKQQDKNGSISAQSSNLSDGNNTSGGENQESRIGGNDKPITVELKPLGWGDLGATEMKPTEFKPRPPSSIGAERQSASVNNTFASDGYGPNGSVSSHQTMNTTSDYFTGTPYSSNPSVNAFAARLTAALVGLSGQQASGSAHRPSYQQMTHTIAAQLKHAVDVGWFEKEVLLQRFSHEQLGLLNWCLGQIGRVERAQKVFEETTFPSHEHRDAARQRIRQEVEQLKFFTNELKVSFQLQSGAGVNGEPFSNLGNTTQSKLDQWKRGPIGSTFDVDAGFSEPAISSYGITNNSLWSNTNSNTGADWPTYPISKKQSQIEVTKEYMDDDAAINAVVDEITHDPNEPKPTPLHRTSTPVEDTNGAASTCSNTASSAENNNRSNMVTPTITNTFDADVPEFKPGQPWLWRDPKELAQDPEATPASLNGKKPSLLLKTTNGMGEAPNAMGGIDGKASASMNNVKGFGNDYAGAMVNGGDPYMRIGPNGYLPSTTRAAAWIKQQAPQDSFASLAPAMTPYYSGTMRNGPPLQLVNPTVGIPATAAYPKMASNAAYVPPTTVPTTWMKHTVDDAWGAPVVTAVTTASSHHHGFMRNGPPLQLVNPIVGVPASGFPRAVPYAAIKPGAPASMPQYVVPYNAVLTYPMQWVVLSNLNTIDDIQLQDMLARIAPISTFVCPPGAGFAAIKFKEGVLEKALPRLTQECAALGIMVQVAKDDEISSLVQGSGYGHMFMTK